MEDKAIQPLRSLLDEWVLRASGRVDVTLDVFASSTEVHRDLWVEWHVPQHGDVDIVDVEAMELLELYARVDYENAWRLIMELTCNEYAGLIFDNVHVESGAEERVYPRFEIRNMEAIHERGTLPQFARWLILPIAPEDHSSKYEETLCLMLSHAEEDGQSSVLRQYRKPIPVKFSFDLTNYALGARLLEDVASLAVIAQDPRRRHVASGRDAHPARPSEAFVLHSVVPRCVNGPVSDAMLVSLQEISSSWGICVERLCLAAAKFARDQVSRRRVADYLRAMLLSHDSTTSTVELTPRLAIGVAQAVCSALVNAQSVEVFKATCPSKRANHDAWWSWVAYAVFSWEATNNIRRLDLDVEKLTDVHVDVFEKVLRAQDPLVHLSQSSEGECSSNPLQRQPVTVDVRPQTALLVAVDTTKEHLIKITTSDKVESLRLVEDSPGSPYVGVMYAGVGLCWLDRDQIIERRTLPTPSLPVAHKIRRLGLIIGGETSLDALVRMVKLVGRGIHTLAIKCISDDLFVPSSVLEALLAACPDVRRLELSQIQVADFHWLTPSKQLEALLLDTIDSVEPHEYNRLLEAVSSRRMGVTKLHIQSNDEVFAEIKDVMLVMLDSNHVLERFFISYDYEDYNADVPPIPEQAPDLKQRNGDPLNMQKMPLALRNKLALISAIQSTSDATTHQKQHSHFALDAEMIAIISRFAAPHKTRVCGAIPFKESW